MEITMLKLDGMWETVESIYRDAVLVSVDSDSLDVTIQRENTSQNVMFTINEWDLMVAFVQKELEKQGI